MQLSLVAVCQTTHTAHDAQDIVVGREHLDLRGTGGGGDLQVGGVDAREVQGAGGLVLLGLQGERVDVDTLVGGDVLVVLEGLHQVEVGTRALGEAVVTVQLQQSIGNHVAGTRSVGEQGGGVNNGRGVVVPVVGTRLGDNPDQLLDGVVQRQLDGVGTRAHALGTGVLQLLNQVLVGQLSEAAALVRVQEDVVNPQRGVGQVGGAGAAGNGVLGIELDVDLDLVVLEGDQGQSQTDVAAEPELEGNEDGLSGSLGNILANHGLETSALARWQRQLVPDVHPVGVVLVDALTTDLDLNGLQQAQTGVGLVGDTAGLDWQIGLQVDTVDQITVAGDLARDAATEANGTVEGLLDGLHGEVGVTAVNHLEEGDLRVTRQVNILGTVGNELEETTTHFRSLLYFMRRKYFWENAGTPNLQI